MTRRKHIRKLGGKVRVLFIMSAHVIVVRNT